MHPICITCGVQSGAVEPPDTCPVCADERQFVGWDGQRWTGLDELRRGHRNVFRDEDVGLVGIGSEPRVGIGQRAVLVKSEYGNILWDCISLIDDQTVAEIEARGGLAAIAISHPHFYASMVEWSRAFGGVPVYLDAADRAWVMRSDPALVLFEDDHLEIAPDMTLIRCGGHFSGSTVLHWAAGAAGRGALLTGDTIQVALDRRFVSFMRSFPNLIPLSAPAVRRIVAAVEPFAFERLVAGWFGRVVWSDAKAAVRRSAERYIRALEIG
jgi:hypothetical protein